MTSLIVIIFLSYHLREYQLNSKLSVFPLKTQPVISKSGVTCKHGIYTILSIDGGGARGVIPLYFLSKIEESIHKPIRLSFDLISGVSVGALIAAKLSLLDARGQPTQIPPGVLNTFVDMTTHMFHVPLLRNVLSINGALSPRYSAYTKYEYLKTLYPKNSAIENLSGHTILVGFDFNKNNIVSFSNYPGCSSSKTHYPLVDILSGISSPLGFFQPQILNNAEGGVQYILSDASYSLEDPTLIAYWCGKKICSSSQVKYYFILSLGAGQYPNINKTKRKLYFGIWHWLPAIFISMLDSGHNEVEKLMKADDNQKLIYIRINPLLTAGDTYPLTANRATIHHFIKEANTVYQENPELFQCIAIILRTRVLTQHCQTVLQEYEKSPKKNTAIIIHLPAAFS